MSSAEEASFSLALPALYKKITDSYKQKWTRKRTKICVVCHPRIKEHLNIYSKCIGDLLFLAFVYILKEPSLKLVPLIYSQTV